MIGAPPPQTIRLRHFTSPPTPPQNTHTHARTHKTTTQTKEMVSSTAYNWIRPSLWTAIFGGKQGLLNNTGNAAAAPAGGAVAGH